MAATPSCRSGIHHTNGIALLDPFIKAFRQQRRLSAIDTLKEALHELPPANRQANHSTQLVFTQPRSKAEKLKASKCFLLSLQQRTSRHGYVSFVPIDRLMLSIPEVGLSFF